MTSGVKIGIIGGTALDAQGIIENRTEKFVKTPYGEPSDALICGKIEGVDCVILSRHGRSHAISPTNINFRANIFALKQEGCSHVIVTTACGSLKNEIEPGHFVILDQFIDRTFKRDVTFFDQAKGSLDGVCHIPMAHPFCPHLREILCQACKMNGVSFHRRGTAVTIEGPRFSTYAESMLYKSWGADVVNMTTVPEATLAKEMGLMYASIAMATDYDCWKENNENVNVESVLEIFRNNLKVCLKILRTAVKLVSEKGDWIKEIDQAKKTVTKAMMG